MTLIFGRPVMLRSRSWEPVRAPVNDLYLRASVLTPVMLRSRSWEPVRAPTVNDSFLRALGAWASRDRSHVAVEIGGKVAGLGAAWIGVR